MSLPPAPPPAAPSPAAALVGAARLALHAPSVFNTQPWRWVVGSESMELYADRRRQLAMVDPDGRLLTISCGAALHHAHVALVGAGRTVRIRRLPDARQPDLLARLELAGVAEPDPDAAGLRAVIPHRRTDRRSFGAGPVPPAVLARLRAAVTAQGSDLHLVRPDQMPMLAVTTAQAAAAETADPAYREELHRWTHRPPDSGDGVPAATAVRQVPRRVPVRDFAPGGTAGLEVGAGHDRGAAYVILFGTGDEPADWLRAGEALSALLLAATREGLSAAPLSDAIEQAWPRRLTRQLLAGLGEPYLVVRLGIATDPSPPPAAPRRDPAEIIAVTG